MGAYQPPYTITPEILNRVAAISEPPQVTPQVGELLLVMQGEMSREALQSVLGLLDRKSFR